MNFDGLTMPLQIHTASARKMRQLRAIAGQADFQYVTLWRLLPETRLMRATNTRFRRRTR